MKTKQILPLLALALAPFTVFSQVQTSAGASPWSITVKATYLETTDGSEAGGPLNLKKNAVSVQDKLIPEFDINYQINDQFAIELVLTIPQEHDVDLAGVGSLGDFKHLPPTLMAKYYPGTFAGFKPYIGAGVNFTLIFDENLGGLKLDTYSVGPAGQVGVDYALTERWSLTLDLKRAMLRSDVKLNGAKITEVKLDPWLYAAGLKYNF